jgi:RNA polymerase sigma factor (sigma-70 family)
MAAASNKGPNTGQSRAHWEDLPDDDLLERFLRGGAIEAQDAFRALVGRHGPWVLGLCRHVLARDHDAEDAFQATFLLLARKGASINDRGALRSWLWEVAYRTALRARANAGRRRAIERQAMAQATPGDKPGDQDELLSPIELRPILHEEVVRLPEKYRAPVILSYLQGKTNQEVADLLNWPIGTVKGRLHRARQLLRSRLSRRGVFPCEGSLSC